MPKLARYQSGLKVNVVKSQLRGYSVYYHAFSILANDQTLANWDGLSNLLRGLCGHVCVNTLSLPSPKIDQVTLDIWPPC